MIRAVVTSAVLALLCGCSLAPQHIDPGASLAPTAAGNASLDPIMPASGTAQTFAIDAPVPTDWWSLFGSPKLDELIQRALAANSDLASAEATLRQAREQIGVAQGAVRPQIDASYQAERQRTSRTYSPPLVDPDNYAYTLHTAQLTIAYPLDLFGGGRNKLASARAAAEVQQARLRAARTTVIANLILTVIQQASLREQIARTQESVAVNRDILRMLIRRQQLGAIGLADVAAQQTALSASEGMLPPLIRSASHQAAAIAALIGISPGNPLPALPALAELHLPNTLPVALPATLVRHRPDVQAAEAQMRGAGADLGAAIAARLPAVQISAAIGGVATRFGEILANGNPFWTLIGGVAQPIFHGGALRHQQRAAEAALDGAKAQYRAAVIQAFMDVSDALTGLRTDAEALDAATRGASAASQNLAFVTRQLALGQTGTLGLLNATSANAQAQAQLVQARAGRLSDTVALFQASGGGL